MKVKSARFGELETDESKVIEMPEGMLGFAEKRFILLTPANLTPFCWLHSVDNPDLAFVVVDAKHCAPDYTFALTAEECRKLELNEKSEAIYLLVVTMAPDPLDITVNLQGPIVLNPQRMIAKQVVLEGGAYTTRHPFFDQSGKVVEVRKSSSRECVPMAR